MDDHSFILESPLLPFVERSFAGIAIARPNPWRIIYANSVLTAWLNCPAIDVPARGLDEMIRTSPPSQLLEAITAVWHGTSREVTISGQLMKDRKRPRPVDLRFVRIATPDEVLLGIIVRETNAAVSRSATASTERRDPLTGLHDRAFLLARLGELLRGGRPSNHHFAVLFVDLDNFKQINDAYGHLVGDGVLAEIARRLSRCVRDEDYIVRFGGDEFVVLLERIADGRDIQPVMQRIHDALEEPIALPAGEFRLSVSIGAAEASPEFGSPEEMLAAADRAMYVSKQERASDNAPSKLGG
jgi:diguanylate cyclase (GGDEF)-like protein